MSKNDFFFGEVYEGSGGPLSGLLIWSLWHGKCQQRSLPLN